MYVSHKRSRSSVRRSLPKSRFYSRVSKVLRTRQPLKKTVNSFAQAPGVSGTPINLGSNTVQVLVNSLFTRVTMNGGAGSSTGGDVAANTTTWTGDTMSGNRIAPKSIMVTLVRGVLRNEVYSPDVTVLMMLVKAAVGVPTPSLTNLFRDLTVCKLIDVFNRDNYTLLAQKDFHVPTAKHTGNYYLPQSKPGGGTSSNAYRYLLGYSWSRYSGKCRYHVPVRYCTGFLAN